MENGCDSGNERLYKGATIESVADGLSVPSLGFRERLDEDFLLWDDWVEVGTRGLLDWDETASWDSSRDLGKRLGPVELGAGLDLNRQDCWGMEGRGLMA